MSTPPARRHRRGQDTAVTAWRLEHPDHAPILVRLLDEPDRLRLLLGDGDLTSLHTPNGGVSVFLSARKRRKHHRHDPSGWCVNHDGDGVLGREAGFWVRTKPEARTALLDALTRHVPGTLHRVRRRRAASETDETTRLGVEEPSDTAADDLRREAASAAEALDREFRRLRDEIRVREQPAAVLALRAVAATLARDAPKVTTLRLVWSDRHGHLIVTRYLDQQGHDATRDIAELHRLDTSLAPYLPALTRHTRDTWAPHTTATEAPGPDGRPDPIVRMDLPRLRALADAEPPAEPADPALTERE